MALPPKKRSGEGLRAAEFNAVRQAARIGSQPLAGRGLETRITPDGIAIALTPTAEQIENAIQAELTSAATADMYSVVEVYNALAGYAGPILAQCRQPAQSGFARLGILLMGAAQGSAPWVQVRGICPVRYAGTVAVGERLGGLKDSYLAQPDQGGPLLVLQLPETGIAVVEITGKRIDAKMVDCTTLGVDASGPYHTIVYKGFTITQNSPGKVTTT